MKTSIVIALICATTSFNVLADTYINPTIGGTNIRDYGKGGYRIDDDGNWTPTIPGTEIRDYGRGGYKKEGNRLIPTIPGTDIEDFGAGGWEIED